MRYKFKLILALILTLFSNAFSLIGPYLTGQTIGAMEDGVDFTNVFLYASLMIVFYVLSAVLLYALSIMMIDISKSVVFQMRQDVFNKLNRLPIQYFDTHQTGDIISRMTYDIDTINQSIAGDVIVLLTSFLTIIVSLSVMIATAPLLVLIFAFTIPLTILLTTFLSKVVKQKFRIRNKKLGELNGFSEEMITGIQTIQAYVVEKEVKDDFDVINEETTESSYQAGYYSTAVMPSVGFISNLSMALVGVFGGILYVRNMMTLAILTSFTLYSRRFSGPINQLSGLFAEIQSALAAAERVFQVLDSEEEVKDLEDAKDYDYLGGDIKLQDIQFSYDGQTTVLENINVEAPQGKVVAIVGPTGSGKTTLVNLLMRFYDPQVGGIAVDQKPVLSYTRDSLRKAFSMILQDSWTFYGTIHDNIAYGNGNISREDVINVAKAAHIHDYIDSLEDGYDTILKNDGTSISKGQKQLIVIARAMLSESKMLIFDEATSNVDTETEMKIHQSMKALMKDKTTFVIAHRLSTIQDADLIMVIHFGKMIELGTHRSLLEQNGFYASLFQSQFE
ncbi:MAG: ABC transporter ATP-binding protein [Firmicutes bacterium]|nr:ABC transporter ATP-binding protein [Bacillota bacterium]